ncbi:MAG: hypothetical protein JXR61_05825 [Prolixibacteraceae bacterium]|nr:hypothetical protein [Prolixibacteraceae bacterium]
MKYILLFFLLIPVLSFSQTDESEFVSKGFKLGVVPQYAIINGARFDLDFQLKNQKHWITLAPQAYISNRDNLDWDYESMTGGGIEVQHRIFLTDQWEKRSVYMAYGPVFNFYSVKDNGLTVRNFVENGGQYIGVTEGEMTTNIYKLGGNLIFGLQYIKTERFFLDLYVGTGIRFSFDNRTTGLHSYYNEWWGDMGYSGALMVGGARFGVIF